MAVASAMKQRKASTEANMVVKLVANVVVYILLGGGVEWCMKVLRRRC
jgi:hypothetical protein